MLGVNVHDANAIGSQLSLNFCSRVAPRQNFEASQVILFCNFRSKNFKDAQLLKSQTVSFKINSWSYFVLSNKLGINFER